jgi:hypothetical protein
MTRVHKLFTSGPFFNFRESQGEGCFDVILLRHNSLALRRTPFNVIRSVHDAREDRRQARQQSLKTKCQR